MHLQQGSSKLVSHDVENIGLRWEERGREARGTLKAWRRTCVRWRAGGRFHLEGGGRGGGIRVWLLVVRRVLQSHEKERRGKMGTREERRRRKKIRK